MHEMKTLTLNGETFDSFVDQTARQKADEAVRTVNGKNPDENGNIEIKVNAADAAEVAALVARAETAATDAEADAKSARTAATEANNAKGSAMQSASTASAKAILAQTHAGTATEKATAAEESATNASASATRAETAATSADAAATRATEAAERAENASSNSGGNVDYVLPVGGDELGGVKNGGNVVINADGTMTAPETSGGSGADYRFLNGLKYYALGDSIASMQGTLTSPLTFGSVGYTKDLQNRDISTLTVEGYVTAIERRYGLVASNFGAAGHTLVADYGTLVAKNYSDVALVTIAYGVNDARTGVPLGTVNSTDVTTFAGALNNLLRKIYTDNPECRVVVLSPMQRLHVSEFGISTPNINGNYLIDFVNMCKAIAEKRSTAFLDQYRCTGINQTNLYYYTVEGVHPVNQGFARIRNAVISILDELFALEYEPIGSMTNTGDTEPEEPETGGNTGGGDSGGDDDGGDIPEDDNATVVDISDQFTNKGVNMDGWGTGSNTEKMKWARYHPIAGKTYTIISYATPDKAGDGVDRRQWSYSYLNDDGSTKSGNYLNGTAGTGAADTYELVTINGNSYAKMTKTSLAAADTADNYYWNIPCHEDCISEFRMSYI